MNTENSYDQQKESRESQKAAQERSAKMKAISKQIAIWGSTAVVLGLAVWGIVILVKNYKPPQGPNSEITLENALTSTDWVKGNRNAKTVLTEYSDFQCPACGAYFPVVKQLENEFGKDLAIVYRHFPLDIHPNARPMARAVEAAGKQNKFWEMHDIVFTNQAKWSNQRNIKESVMGYAKTLGLDLKKFEADFESSELTDKINKAYTDGVAIGIGYTPSFFLNGKLIPNPANYNEFKALISNAIEESKKNAAQ